MAKLEMTINPRPRDLGGFSVRRILPYATHRMVGPFIFLDHMGPVDFQPGTGMDVRPHPHINLATVTYLFEGAILHRDSLGSEQLIEPGAINWMTAGRGIVHSERSPQKSRETGATLHGLQCWVALPTEFEECAPSFVHYPADRLPEFEQNSVRFKLLVGSLFGQSSPVVTHSDILYADVQTKARSHITIPPGARDLAAYALDGDLTVNGEHVVKGALAVARAGDGLDIQSATAVRFMILGGTPIQGDRHIFWNFVSSSKERIEKAKQDWREQKFPKVPGDEQEFIPLPEGP